MASDFFDPTTIGQQASAKVSTPGYTYQPNDGKSYSSVMTPYYYTDSSGQVQQGMSTSSYIPEGAWAVNSTPNTYTDSPSAIQGLFDYYNQSQTQASVPQASVTSASTPTASTDVSAQNYTGGGNSFTDMLSGYSGQLSSAPKSNLGASFLESTTGYTPYGLKSTSSNGGMYGKY